LLFALCRVCDSQKIMITFSSLWCKIISGQHNNSLIQNSWVHIFRLVWWHLLWLCLCCNDSLRDTKLLLWWSWLKTEHNTQKEIGHRQREVKQKHPYTVEWSKLRLWETGDAHFSVIALSLSLTTKNDHCSKGWQENECTVVLLTIST
jgi:hypothetical protein